MTEQRFDELINLYLDNEIGRSDLGELKHAIKDNLLRRRKFERSCELHQAARKALTAPTAGEKNDVRQPAPGRSASPGDRGPSWRKSSAGSSRESVKSKQSQAHRNAAVSVLADRQQKQGSASTLALDSIDIESRSSRRSSSRTGAAHTFTFFDSPLGMLLGMFLSVVGVAGLYLLLHVSTPGSDDGDPGSYAPQSPISQLDGGYDPKAAEELAAEVKRRKAATVAADALRARLYQSALTGQASSNQTTVDYFSSHLDAATAGNTLGNTSGSVPPSTESVAPAISTKSDGSNAAPAAQP
jgi:hypothetical protein